MELQFSIIVPVFNRPQEVEELLESLTKQSFDQDFEVLIIEDGSDKKSDEIVDRYGPQLDCKYFYKDNSGAGKSRNFGMTKASGNYFIILDSDVILPKDYLSVVYQTLTHNYTDAFGGPDAAHSRFTPLQKAINYSMTSFLTTGGLRGKKNGVGKFQLRSFNMGLSKEAFEKSNGFSDMKTGEDIDFTFRLWNLGYTTQLITEAYVYHKRRTSIRQFFKQTYGFGKARPILNNKYTGSARITYWFPTLFLMGIDIGIIFSFFGNLYLLGIYFTYFFILFLHASFTLGIWVGLLTIITTVTQFLGYGLGIFESYYNVNYKNERI